MKKVLCYTLLMLIATLGHAQKVDQQNIWFTYNGDHKLTEKLTANTLVSIRRNDGLANPQQTLGRLLFNYNLVENFKVGAGYDYIVTVPYGEQPLPFNIKEHRIVLQAIAKSSIRKVKVGQLLKYEHRIQELPNETRARERLRYRISTDIPLWKGFTEEDGFYLNLFNEILINVDNAVYNHILDQNWAYIGLEYKVNRSTDIKLGYMNQYLLKPDLLHVENNHTIALTLGKNLDFSKPNQ